MTTELPYHALANIFPLIEGAEFDSLCTDIKEHGLREKIVLLNGSILDGRNRYRASIAVGGAAADGDADCFREFDPTAEGEPEDFVVSKNVHRRHLDESQRAYAAATLADMPRHRPVDKSANLQTSQAEAALKLNVSTRLVASAKKVQEKGTPSLNHAVQAGKLPASSAAKAAGLPEAQQNEIARQAEAGAANVVRTVIKQGVRAVREAELGAKQAQLPDSQYGVILADPEWEFVTFSKITGVDRSASNHYPTSPWETIGARDVQKLSAKDCLLLLWVTDLARGIRVMESWGFEYKSYFVWVKDIVVFAGIDFAKGAGDSATYFKTVGPAGTGYWNRDRDELLLIGTRGQVPAPAMGTQGESVIFAARPKITGTMRGKHSAKPAFAHEWVDKHYPTLPKIELNARTRRAGWDAWGLEAPAESEAPPAKAAASQETENTEIPQGAHGDADHVAEGPSEREQHQDAGSKPGAVARAPGSDPGELPAFLDRRKKEPQP
jgi:N6-adenosine-specific RNA methylase IME4